MEKEVKEKYLPIGTVVKLFGGDPVFMITGYCVKPEGKIRGPKGEIEIKEDTIFDYCACLYPTGIVNNEVFMVFNHENIERVLFTGLESKLQNDYCNFLKEEMKKRTKKEDK